ncbi:hypothetical protein HYT92_03090 [Candidatus Pacearchaeota archaeon]|nr:hypothetical protein [Candidatus Pacearchaeota archaeon]
MADSYSERAIEGADFSGSGEELIQLMYGVVTSANNYNHDFQVGREIIKENQLVEKLKRLSKETGRLYRHNVINSEETGGFRVRKMDEEDGEEKGEMNTIGVVGVVLPQKIDASYTQSADSIIAGKDICSIIEQSEKIVRELKSIGFPDEITKNDLYLYAGYYRD